MKYLQNYKTKCVVSLAIQQSYYNNKQRIHKVISLDMITSGEDIVFSKGAVVEAGVFAVEGCSGGDSSAFAEAIVDPVFEFDQARFDTEMGVDTFTLSDFYEIRVSPNLGQLLFKDDFEE